MLECAAPSDACKRPAAPTPAISDLVAREVDQAVAALSVEDPKVGNVVVGHYLFGMPESKLARKLHCRPEKIEVLLRRRITFVSDRLDGE